MHQDREGYGNAVPDDLKVQDMNLMQEMGVNAIRTSHYPHSQSTYNLADERGMLVYCEIPYYLLLSNAESYKTSIKEELKEMIRQGYNHPSIMMWGIENEVYQPASAAAFGKDFQINENTLVSFNSSVAKLAQKEDTTRYIVQAQIDSSNANKVCAKWSKNGNVDYTGVNLYVGFKSSVSSADDEGRKEITDTLNRKLNEYKQTYNASSMMITEYGAGANINQHATMDENFSWSSDDASKDKHYEEYQAFVLETYYSLIQKRKDIPVSFVWNMFDFSCYRNEGGIPRRNTKGLVCYDHTTKKDAFYFYKANWNQQDKFVYLTSKRYTERDTKYQQIKVYSNCEGVELFVNGQSVGKGRKQQSGVFVWDDVKLDDMNTIKAVGTSDGQTYSDEVSGIKAENKNSATSIKYQTHIQSIGWQEAKKDGQTSGTIGKGLRMEALKVKLQNKKYGGNIEYRTHIAQKGWQDWKKNGQTAGTTGEKLAMEAVRLKLTGELAEHYDIYYRVHSQSYGWLGWAKNGEIAGTAGLAKRMEAIQIKLVEKGGKAPGTSEKHYVSNQGVFYQSHVQTYGWQTWKQNGETSGTSGQAKRLEAIKIKLQKMKVSGNIEYQSHVQTYGWEKSWKKNGQLSGTSGKAKRLEAVKIRLTGEMKNKYDVYYRVHAQSYGWLGWAKNGEKAGSSTYGKRLEAIEIKLVKKGESAPGSTKKAYQVPRIQYQTHVQSIGWQKKVSDNQIAGTTGQGKRIEAIKITLPDSDYTGNVEYQAYVQGIGWQSWKKNGELAGTSGQSKRIEAIRVKLTGEIAKYYEVYYSIHLAKIGWCNYESAGRVTGTIDLSKKIEALKICLVKKDAETAPNTSGVKYVEGYKSGNFYYNGYIKGVGATGNVSQGNTVGTIGKKQQLQSLTLYLDQSNKLAPSGTIQYATHIAKEGWKDWSDAGTTNGASTGTNGMEAVKIRLTGNLAKYYDIYYRAHVQGYGWLGWAKNGQAAGTSKIGYRMEGLQIRLVSKDAAAPGKNANYYTEKKKTATIAVKDQMHLRALAYASNTRYLILVDTTANRVGIYSGSVGKWNEVKKWVCTTGAKSTPTVKGTFTVQGKGKSFGSGYTCWYYTQFYGNYLFHSVLYKQGSMSVITDGRLGINASHGCVRLNINNAKWIYDNIPRGTKVVVY